MANTTVKIDGLRELENALRGLTKATGKNVLRRVLRKRAEPIAEAASAAAPDDPSTPGKSIKFSAGPRLTKRQAGLHRKMFKNDKASAEMFVGQEGSGPAPVQQEFGNINHGPQPSLRPAWDSASDQVLEGISDDLWTEVDNAARRLAKKQAKAAANGG